MFMSNSLFDHSASQLLTRHDEADQLLRPRRGFGLKTEAEGVKSQLESSGVGVDWLTLAASAPPLGSLSDLGDLSVTDNDFSVKHKQDSFVLNAKSAYELSIVAKDLGRNNKTRSGRQGDSRVLNVAVARSKSLTHRSESRRTQPANSKTGKASRIVRTGALHTSSATARVSSTLQTGHAATKVKKGLSDRQGTTDRHAVKKRSLSRGASDTRAKVQPQHKHSVSTMGTSPTQEQRARCKLQKKSRLKVKSGSPRVDRKHKTMNKLLSANTSQLSATPEKLKRNSEMTSSLLRNMIKAKNAVVKGVAHLTGHGRAASMPSLIRPSSPRSSVVRSATSTIRTTSTITEFKSVTITKRPKTVTKLSKSHPTLATPRKLKSSSGVKGLAHQPKRPEKLEPSDKKKSTKVTISTRGTSSPKVAVRKSSKRRKKSATAKDTEIKSGSSSARSEKSSKKLSKNANANNANEITASESPSNSVSGLSTSDSAFNDTTRQVRNHGATYDQLLPRSNIVPCKKSTNSHPSAYSPADKIEIKKAPPPAGSATYWSALTNNNTNSLTSDPEEADRQQDEVTGSLYETCFQELVSTDFVDELFSTASDHHRHNKQRVRFNLANSQATRRRLSSRTSTRRAPVDTSPGHRLRALFRSTGQERPSALRWLQQCEAKSMRTQQKPSGVRWPNIWYTELKSKKWRGISASHSSTSNPGSTSSSDEDWCGDEGGVSEGRDGQVLTGQVDSEDTFLDSSRPARRTNKKREKLAKRNTSLIRSTQERPEDIVFPPYSPRASDQSQSNDVFEALETESDVNPTTSTVIPSPMSSVVEDKQKEWLLGNSELQIGLTLPPPLAQSRSPVQDKWLHLQKASTRETRLECQDRGYIYLQGLCRGNARVHSLQFLATNQNNLTYNPVEVTATRLPYANFTSSVLSLGGPITDRKYVHTWVKDLPQHPNLLMLLERFCTKNWVYHVTQYCSWPPLNHVIVQTSLKSTGPNVPRGLKEDTCKTIFRQICSAIDHLHQLDIVHGDLSSCNVLVSNTFQVKLAGYGPLSQRMMSPLQSVKGHIPLQGDGYSLCTPPELMVRRDVWSKSCDVWCMGIVLLEMVLGGVTPEMNATLRLNGSHNTISHLRLPSCGYQLSRLVDKILQPVAADRPSVAAISTHPWLSDGSELGVLLSHRRRSSTLRRTDGSTFPLPKRLQKNENPLDFDRDRCLQPAVESSDYTPDDRLHAKVIDRNFSGNLLPSVHRLSDAEGYSSLASRDFLSDSLGPPRGDYQAVAETYPTTRLANESKCNSQTRTPGGIWSKGDDKVAADLISRYSGMGSKEIVSGRMLVENLFRKERDVDKSKSCFLLKLVESFS